MSKHKIQLALNRMAKGLALYGSGMEALDESVSDLCGFSIEDLVNDDVERQDAVFAIVEGISVDAETILEWIDEKRAALAQTTEGETDAP